VKICFNFQCFAVLCWAQIGVKETNIMVDVLDSSIRVFQTAFPSVMQYLGNAKDREAKAARED
jgi:hypothetical protein